MKTYLLLTLALWFLVGCAPLPTPGKTTALTTQTQQHINMAKTEVTGAKTEVSAMPAQPHKDAALAHLGSADVALGGAATSNAAAATSATQDAQVIADQKKALEKTSVQYRLRIAAAIVAGLGIAFAIVNLLWLHMPGGWKISVGLVAIATSFMAYANFLDWLGRVLPYLEWGSLGLFVAVLAYLGWQVSKHLKAGDTLPQAIEGAVGLTPPFALVLGTAVQNKPI